MSIRKDLIFEHKTGQGSLKRATLRIFRWLRSHYQKQKGTHQDNLVPIHNLNKVRDLGQKEELKMGRHLPNKKLQWHGSKECEGLKCRYLSWFQRLSFLGGRLFWISSLTQCNVDQKNRKEVNWDMLELTEVEFIQNAEELQFGICKLQRTTGQICWRLGYFYG